MNSVIEALHIYDEHKLVDHRALYLLHCSIYLLANDMLVGARFSPTPTPPGRCPQLICYLYISNIQHHGPT